MTFYGYKCEYLLSNEKKVTTETRHKFLHAYEDTVYFDENEFIIKIKGLKDKYINQLELITNKHKYKWGGLSGTSFKF